MSELRKDPIFDRWVIMAPERAGKPTDFAPLDSTSPSPLCPFCPENEDQTPVSTLVLPPDGTEDSTSDRAAPWSVRVVPNRYPALSPPNSGPACAWHEVVIESPQHVVRMHELSGRQFEHVVQVWAARLRTLAALPGVAHVTLFKNSGAAAGASLEHVHSQLLATPFVPPALETKRRASARHRVIPQSGLSWSTISSCLPLEEDGHDGNVPHVPPTETVWQQMLDADRRAGRVIVEQDGLALFCPAASRFPWEMGLLSVAPEARFEDRSESELKDVAALLRIAFQRLEAVAPGVAFNLTLYSAPLGSDDASFHWHFEILPRVNGIAGFELGTGTWINTLLPELAAEQLRSAGR